MLDLIIVDDEKFMAKVFNDLLKDTNLTFEIYHDAHEGLEAIVAKKPRCVVLDYNMPDINGDELIIKTSEECLFKHTNFMLVSGNEFGPEDKMKLMTLGFLHIFPKKELRTDHFLETLNELIEDKKLAS